MQEFDKINEQFSTFDATEVGELTVEEKAQVSPEAQLLSSVALLGDPEATPEKAKESLSPSFDDFKQRLFTGESQEESTLLAQLNSLEDFARKQQNAASNPIVDEQQVLAQNNPSINSWEQQFTAKKNIAIHLIQEAIKESTGDKGFFGFVYDFLDYFIARGVITGAEDVTARKTRRGEDFGSLMVDQNFTIEEWTDRVKREIEDSKAEGVFSSDNVFALSVLMEEVRGRGYNPSETLDRVFGSLDLVLPATGIAKATKLLKAKSVSKASKVADTEGPEAAQEITENTLKVTSDPPTANSAGPKAYDLHNQDSRPGIASVQKVFVENELVKKIKEGWTKNAFGRLVDEAELDDLAKIEAGKLSDKLSRPVFDYNIEADELGNFNLVTRVGTDKKGTPYAGSLDDPSVPSGFTVDKANQLGGVVVQADPDDVSKGFFIQLTDPLDTKDLILRKGIEDDSILKGISRTLSQQVGRLVNNPFFGSSIIRDVERLATDAQRAEASRGLVKDLVKPYEKKIKRVSNEEAFGIDAVIRELRDGRASHNREWYSKEEFLKAYERITGIEASTRAIEAYEALVTISDATFALRSSLLLGKYVRKGYRNSVDISRDSTGIYYPAKRVDVSDIPENARILDVSTGVDMSKADVENLPLWRLDKATDEGYDYAYTPAQVRALAPSDVLGYNPGGSRINPNANYFVTIGSPGSRIKSMLTAFSEKDAIKATEELQAIQKGLKENASNIDDIIARNSDWSGGVVRTRDALMKVVDEDGWRGLEGDIAFKKRDETLLLGGTDNDGLWEGASLDEFVQADMRRNDSVLREFGGATAFQDSPITAIGDSFGNVTYAYTNNVYAVSAMNDWVKTAQKFGIAKVGDDFESIFWNTTQKGTTTQEKRLFELKRIIERRLGYQDAASQAVANAGQKISEFVFNNSNRKLAPKIGDPTNTLLSLGFQSSFGFFAVSQFFMQGFQAATIAAISPISGLKAATLVPSLRLTLRAAGKDEATKVEAINRFAKAADISTDEAEDLVDYLRTSGRLNVDAESAEANLGPSFGLSGFEGDSFKSSVLQGQLRNIKKYGGAALDAGLTPFRAGDRLARLTSQTTAFFEFKKQFPKGKATSDFGRDWISRRDQTLSFNMTNVARSNFQQGLLKVPTQWLSYSLRAMEAVVLGRGFTTAERLRLTTALLPMYGLTGFGMGHAADYIAEKLGVTPGESLHMLIKYGFFEGLGTELLGAENTPGVSARLAPIGAFTDLYRKLSEDQTYQALGGPSGEIVGSTAIALVKSLTHAFNDRNELSLQQLIRVARQPSGVDSVAKAVGILEYSQYINKSGKLVKDDMELPSALISALGFTPLSIVDMYERMGTYYKDKELLRTIQADVRNSGSIALRRMLDDDPEVSRSGSEMLSDIMAQIDTSPIPLAEKLRLKSGIRSTLNDNYNKLMKHYLKLETKERALFSIQALNKTQGVN